MEYLCVIVIALCLTCANTEDEVVEGKALTMGERLHLREEARDMFYHAYHAYTENAYPADELMPLSCKGRYRGVTPSRGDMDDVLGNYSLTLVDTLDTLVVMGDFREFSRAVKMVIRDVSFDSDIIVSVFETNIRMLGGMLSAHVLAEKLKQDNVPALLWYNGELLGMAEDLGRRLLPAFNTSTGIPHGRVNLRSGLKGINDSSETCTACAGTMILEMAALSRLTGNSIYEKRAHAAMDSLWKIRHRTSDLMGTVINIHSGDWVRKDSGVGAGIDSYYEYCLKAYVLLGDEKYLNRFQRHYYAVMKYINQSPFFMDVHMHRPHMQSRNFMDSLLAFWPGLQVLLGDVKPAVETHEMLYQLMQKHTFIPEAFTPDFQIHWAQHPLRPEFLESTYFLHRATGDDHYLRVGEAVLKMFQKYARVKCGYAAINDVRTHKHEDRMDSFVLAETFKYLYMLFGNDTDLPMNINDYVLTTEAHFLPLALASIRTSNSTQPISYSMDDVEDNNFARSEPKYWKSLQTEQNYEDICVQRTCPNMGTVQAEDIRVPLRKMIGNKSKPIVRFFNANDPEQRKALSDMGISVLSLNDGRLQLMFSVVMAKSVELAEQGLSFMKEMSEWTDSNDLDRGVKPAGVLIGSKLLTAGPGNFGKDLSQTDKLSSSAVYSFPSDACSNIENSSEVKDKFAIAVRGKCTFAQKARNLKAAGARAVIVLDNEAGTSSRNTPMFAMSGDGERSVKIPAVFLFSEEADILKRILDVDKETIMTIGRLTSLDYQMQKIESPTGDTDDEYHTVILTTAHQSLDLDLSQTLDFTFVPFNQLGSLLGQLYTHNKITKEQLIQKLNMRRDDIVEIKSSSYPNKPQDTELKKIATSSYTKDMDLRNEMEVLVIPIEEKKSNDAS